MVDVSIDKTPGGSKEALYKALLQNPSLAIMVVQDMQVVLCNEATERIVGYTAREFRALGADALTRILHPDSRAMVIERYRRRMEGIPQADPFEVHIITQSNDSRWVEACATRVAYRERPAILVSFMDITDRIPEIRGLELRSDLNPRTMAPDGAADPARLLQRVNQRTRELEDANAYMSTVLETSHDGILVVDAEGRFEYGNQAFFRTFGWPRDELMGAFFMKVVPPELHAYMMQRWAEVQAGKGAPYETEIVSKAGERRALLVSHRHMTIAGERKYCVVTKDITDKKRAERELHAHRERLEELVAERTGQLRQRSEELARLAEELTLVEYRERQRVAQCLHDNLQQLLVGARLQSEAMASLEGDQRSDAVKKLNELLTETINTARELTKDMAPLIALKRELADGFEWIVHDARERHQLEVDAQIEIGDELKDAPEAIAVLLFTAARELLLNVVKHADTAHAALRLTRQDGAVVLDVSDQGCGIDSSVPIVPGQTQGFGLLSIRERVELLGGTFQVDTATGAGTRVRVAIPFPWPLLRPAR